MSGHKKSKKLSENFLLKLIQFRDQIKLYHWQTKLYSRHKASDKFLKKYQEITDKLIEAYQGRYGTIYLNKNRFSNIKIMNIKDSDIIKFFNFMREYLIIISPEIFDKNRNGDLFNLRDEILAEIDQTIYLFRQI